MSLSELCWLYLEILFFYLIGCGSSAKQCYNDINFLCIFKYFLEGFLFFVICDPFWENLPIVHADIFFSDFL